MSNKHKKTATPNLSDLLHPEQATKAAEKILEKMQENKGMTLQQAIGLSDELLEEIYGLAHNYYTHGNYKESVALFEMLTVTSPNTYKFALGLAASYHQQGEFEVASYAFYNASELEPENPMPYYYIADCLLKQEKHELASVFLDIAVDTCQDRAEHSRLKERCILINKPLKEKYFNNN